MKLYLEINITKCVQEGYSIARFRDAMYLYGMALNKTILSRGDFRNGTQIFGSTKYITFEGNSKCN